MSFNVGDYIRRKTYPLVFGTAIVAVSIAFINRRYFLRNISEEAQAMAQGDPEFKDLYEKTRLELNR